LNVENITEDHRIKNLISYFFWGKCIRQIRKHYWRS